jgi:hypothetical protein
MGNEFGVPTPDAGAASHHHAEAGHQPAGFEHVLLGAAFRIAHLTVNGHLVIYMIESFVVRVEEM